MRTARRPAPTRPGGPGGGWSLGRVRRADTVELTLAGVRVVGTVAGVGPDTFTVEADEQPGLAALQLAVAYGTAAFPGQDGAVIVPVSVRAQGTSLQAHVIGPPSMLQRRLHRRVKLQLPVTVAWLGGPDGTWERATSESVDMSRGGMRIGPTVAEWPEVGASVVVSVDVPEPVRIEATVIGVMPDNGIRLQFAEPDAATARRLEGLLA